MNRNPALIDFDGVITTLTNAVLPEPTPQMFYHTKKIDKDIGEYDIKEVIDEGHEGIAVSKYKLVYESSNRVFYGRFE